MRHYPEIVKVIDGVRLIDAESYEHRYHTAGGVALGVGYYVVSWPEDTDRACYDERACYQGPYRSFGHARLALERCLDQAPAHLLLA